MNPLFGMFGNANQEREKDLNPETKLQRQLHANLSSIEMELMQLDVRFEDSSLDEADRRLRQDIASILPRGHAGGGC
jgi:hypothetical protein